MKKILLVGALAVAGLVYSQPSQAYYHGRWCAKIDNGGGSVGERCDFPSYETCRAYIRGESRSFCSPNQWYRPYWTGERESEYRVYRRYN
jgi:hypothetical protein